MICFPNAKINLGLNVISKRPDGFHNIESIFIPIQLTDALEVVEAKECTLYVSGKAIAGNTNDNLCYKAYMLLKNDFKLPPVSIYLHKVIPMGAGLGGGSADAAFLLTLLNKKYELNLGDEILKKYALQLGSDCAFFIENKPAFVEGRGEILSGCNVNLSGYKIVLIHPGIHVNTKEAYVMIKPQKPPNSLSECCKQEIKTWKDTIVNDFEKPVFAMHPLLEKIKNDMYSLGAIYASMSGSGSSIYGIFDAHVKIEKDNFSADYFFWRGRISV